MTNYEWPGVIPGFDVLKWKAETQAQILRETEGMSDEEVREYFRQGAERYDKETKRRREERETEEIGETKDVNEKHNLHTANAD